MLQRPGVNANQAQKIQKGLKSRQRVLYTKRQLLAELEQIKSRCQSLVQQHNTDLANIRAKDEYIVRTLRNVRTRLESTAHGLHGHIAENLVKPCRKLE